MEKSNILVYEKDNNSVEISTEVIGRIAGIAATEVEGVHSMAGGITNEIVSKLGRKSLSAGVSVIVNEDKEITILMALVIKLGCSIPAVSKAVQEKVKNAVESMTGLTVKSVDIKIANVKVG